MIGVFGIGFLVVELLVCKGVGYLILIDFDIIEYKNFNCIVNFIIVDVDEN